MTPIPPDDPRILGATHILCDPVPFALRRAVNCSSPSQLIRAATSRYSESMS